MKKFLLVGAFGLLIGMTASAALPEQAPVAQPVAQKDCSRAMNFGTGEPGKGFDVFHTQLETVCPAEVSGVTMCTPVRSSGSLANLDLLDRGEVDLAYLDAMTWTIRAAKFPNYNKYQVVKPVWYNNLHFLARKNGRLVSGGTSEVRTKTFGGYGKDKVNVVKAPDSFVPMNAVSESRKARIGTVGSAELLAPVLNGAPNNMEWTFTNFDTDDLAQAALNAGQIDIVVSVAAWPAGPIDKLTEASGLVLLKWDLAVPQNTSIIQRNYAKMKGYSIPMVAVPVYLVTNPFQPGGDNARAITSIRACLNSKLSTLQEGRDPKGKPFHPGWKEVGDRPPPAGMTMFKPESMGAPPAPAPAPAAAARKKP